MYLIQLINRPQRWILWERRHKIVQIKLFKLTYSHLWWQVHRRKRPSFQILSRLVLVVEWVYQVGRFVSIPSFLLYYSDCYGCPAKIYPTIIRQSFFSSDFVFLNWTMFPFPGSGPSLDAGLTTTVTVPFASTNAQGQRICRQCGMVASREV